MQSNEMVENDILQSRFVDKVYDSVAKSIKKDSRYNSGKMNILKASRKNITLTHDERNCKVYELKKEWKKQIGV